VAAPRLLSSWYRFWQGQYFAWQDRRAPLATSHQLTHKNLGTFPTRQGLAFTLVLIVMWVLGTNYQNNLILALCYFFASLIVVAILNAFANLSGLRIRVIGAEPVFAGERAGLVVELCSDRPQGAENIRLCWDGCAAEPVSLAPGDPLRVTLWLPAPKRGYLRPRRLLVESQFPLGMIRCWCWLRLDARALVYPRPLALDEPRSAGAGADQGDAGRQRGDEFQGLRDYIPGDQPKHIAWKQFAQERGLYTKEYQEPISAEKWLDWYALNYPQEQRLSDLCHWALVYDQQQLAYGLRLPGLELAPARGSAQRQQVLQALALFDLPQEKVRSTQ